MPSYAPKQLQLDASSDQDSTQVQSCQHFCGCGTVVRVPLVLEKEGLSLLEGVDRCHSFFLLKADFWEFLRTISSWSLFSSA